MIHNVKLSKKAKKDLEKVPIHIVYKLQLWVSLVAELGLEETRKYNGFNDKVLQGKRFGQRSIRLSKAYRAFYVLEYEQVKVVLITEVNKHEY